MPKRRKDDAGGEPPAEAATPRAADALGAADLRQVLLDLAARLAPRDVEHLVDKEGELRDQLAREEREDLWRFRLQGGLALDLLRDHHEGECPQIPYSTVSLLGAAVLYLADAMDVVPDFLPRVGHLDDAAVLELAFERAAEGIQRYCDWKGIDSTRLWPHAGESGGG